jgi:hypothetical protein
MSEDKYEGKITGREFLPENDNNGMGISGTWMNKRTGQKVNVRQSVQDGDNMIIITDRGQISMDVFSRDYIQASDEIYDESGKVIDNKPMEMDEDLGAIMDYENGNTGMSVYESIPVVNPNDQIIKKVFDKLTSFPEVKVNIQWDNFPEAQINTLVNFLDVKVTDISNYIINNYVNSQALSESIDKILKDKLSIEDKTDEE